MLEKLKIYRVTKSNSDGSIKKNDMIYLSENRNIINVTQGKLWLSEDEWDVPGMNDFEAELDNNYMVIVNGNKERVIKIGDRT